MSDYVTWKNSELTQKQFARLELLIEKLKDQWEVGNFPSDRVSEYQRGIIRGLRMSMEEVE